MASKNKDKYIKELEERVEELEDRMSAIEDIFAPAILDRQTAHVEAKQGDARDTLSQGDVKTVKIFDPPGQGSDPDSGVGKIDGIVTFVNCDGLAVEQDDVVHCRITNVLPNAAHGVATQMAEYDE
ncbi:MULTISPECIES: TRAM domain-containing protein [Halobacteriales]|nr:MULTISPECIES: TRAM domain-containing protein [Halobacteriales]